jgi:hypothetical protein
MNLNSLHVQPIQSASNVAVKEGNLEDDIDQMINNVMEMLLLHYPTTATESLAALVRTPVRLFLNEALSVYIKDSKKYPLHCANVDIPDKNIAQPLQLNTNGEIVLFNELINKDSTIDAINSFIECVGDVVTSYSLFSGHFFNVTLGEYSLVLHDMQFENANSVYELGLLRPEIDSYHLSNLLSFGKRNNSGQNTTLSFGMNVLHNNQGIGNVNVHINMINFKLHAGTELKFDMNWFPHLIISDLLSHPQCISIPVTEMSFYGFNARVEELRIEIGVVMSDGVSPGTFTSYVTNNTTELAFDMSNLMTEGAKMLEEHMIKSSFSLMDQGSDLCKTPANPQRTHMSNRSTAHAGLWTFLIVLVFVGGNAWLFMSGFKTQNTQSMNVAATEPQPPSNNDQEEEKKSSDPEFNR